MARTQWQPGATSIPLMRSLSMRVAVTLTRPKDTTSRCAEEESCPIVAFCFRVSYLFATPTGTEDFLIEINLFLLRSSLSTSSKGKPEGSLYFFFNCSQFFIDLSSECSFVRIDEVMNRHPKILHSQQWGNAQAATKKLSLEIFNYIISI